MQRFTRNWILSLLVAAIGLAGLATACGGNSNGDEQSVEVGGSSEPAYYGAMVSPAPVKPDLVLTDTSGEPYDMQKETEGQVTLLYLGYTNCPDTCPTFMSTLAAVKKQLDPAVAQKISVVFITTDPERDTPQVIGKWLNSFDKDFVGLTGDPDTLVQLQKSLGMQPAQKEDAGNGEYGVNHAAYVLAFTPQDNVAHVVYPLGISRADWVHDLTKLVERGWVSS